MRQWLVYLNDSFMYSFDQRKKSLLTEFSRAFYKLRVGISPKRVHRLRATIRRAESFISLAHPQLGRKQEKLVEELIELRKRAGRVRNLDVQIRLLGSIANGSTASDRRVLVQMFKAKREKQSGRLLSLLKKLDKLELVGRLEKLLSKISLIDDGNKPIDPLEQARKEFSRLVSEIPAGNLKPRLVDGLRLGLKRIRYTAELADASDAQRQFLETIKPVQDAIGEWHDWEALVKTAEEQFGERVNCPLLVEMRSLFAAKYSAASSAVSNLRPSLVPVPKKHPQQASPVRDQARIA